MKPLLPVAVALALAFGNAAMAAQPVDDTPPAGAPQSANERAGLPDLEKINRPAAQVSSKVEINVHSNLGTRYQMSAPLDTSPTVRDNGRASTRLPSVNLTY